MKLYLSKSTAARAGRAANTPETPWVRFGEETVFLVSDNAAPSRSAREIAPGKVKSKRQLFVVVQNGRLFQQLYPRVPVLHDRGRYLLVKLDPTRARELKGKHKTCYDVLPLVENEAVFESVERGTSARAPVPFVQNLVNRIARGPFEASLVRLVTFPTRLSTSPQFQQALTFARTQLTGLGFTCRAQSITVNGRASSNLIADKVGTGAAAARQVVIASAHLDSINLAGPTKPAPGADDNGTGSAGILELARVFSTLSSTHDLRLILFGGEEQGLFGSTKYVASLSSAQRAKVRAIVNMDMIGSLNTTRPGVLLEGKAVSQGVINKLSAAAATYTGLEIETSLNAANSDHVPFLSAQMPAVLTIEGADSTNHNVHSANDTLDRVNFGLALEILRMNAAFIAMEIK